MVLLDKCYAWLKLIHIKKVTPTERTFQYFKHCGEEIGRRPMHKSAVWDLLTSSQYFNVNSPKEHWVFHVEKHWYFFSPLQPLPVVNLENISEKETNLTLKWRKIHLQVTQTSFRVSILFTWIRQFKA